MEFEYVRWKNGKTQTVYKFEDCIRAIKICHEDNLEKIDKLREENRKLREEYDKDEEVRSLKEKLDIVCKDNLCAFPITEDEQQKINDWKSRHDREVHGLNNLEDKLAAGGAIGGRYYYKFTPTSIGTVGEIVCDCCGKSFAFQELS